VILLWKDSIGYSSLVGDQGIVCIFFELQNALLEMYQLESSNRLCQYANLLSDLSKVLMADPSYWVEALDVDRSGVEPQTFKPEYVAGRTFHDPRIEDRLIRLDRLVDQAIL
jgi:hypothetical protein